MKAWERQQAEKGHLTWQEYLQACREDDKETQEIPDYSEEAKTRSLYAMLEEFVMYLGYLTPDNDDVKRALAYMKIDNHSQWQSKLNQIANNKWQKLNENFFKEISSESTAKIS